MNGITDVLIRAPFYLPAAKGMLFFVFVLHFLFVLFTVGTAILAVTYLLEGRRGSGRPDRDKFLLERFFIHKSLAVTLGVGAILLMMLINTVPFFTAIRLVPGGWMLLVALMLLAFGLLEYVLERKGPTGRRHVVAAVAGLACMLAVPAVFSAVIASAENPRWWTAVLWRAAPGQLAAHWSARFLHVLGASVVFAAALQFLFLSRRDEAARASFRKWIVGGLIFQFVAGVGLLASLPRRPDAWTAGVMLYGIAAAAVLLWALAGARWARLGPATGAILLVFILLPMLLTRQFLQDAVVVPVNDLARSNARLYTATLAPFRSEGLAIYEANRGLDFSQPQMIYLRSCKFCHGGSADGQGEDAPQLFVKPEDLTALRARPGELRKILLNGVDGSAMPYFGVYTAGQLDGLINLLYTQYGVKERPEPPSAAVSPEDRAQAELLFQSTCSICHGADGARSEFGRHLRPPPPDLQRLALAPQHAFDVITNGYPGTVMPSFARLPEPVRWALVEVEQSKYQAGR